MFRYVHTNIIAKDPKRLIAFYKEVLNCKSFNSTRDLKGEWVDRFTGVKNAHIMGEHLVLPGYEDKLPTLEIFAYDKLHESLKHEINSPGFAHIAFEVDDVETTVEKLLKEGGSMVGEIIKANYPNHVLATLVYTRDPEGNIIELQSWKTTV